MSSTEGAKTMTDAEAHAIAAVVDILHALPPASLGLVLRAAAVQTGASSSREEATQAAFHALSPREREVLVLLLDGQTNDRIATVLGISAKTVETHRAKIMRKSAVHSLAQLLRLAIGAGYFELA